MPPPLAFAAATVALLAASAGPAAAGTGYGQLIVNPGTAAPGQSVSILGVCPTNGSVLTGVHSAAFAGGSASITVGAENFTGTATIAASVAPGSYTVAASCGAGSPSVSITVVAGSVATTPTTARTTAQPPRTHTSAAAPTTTMPRTAASDAMAAPASTASAAKSSASAAAAAASSMSAATATSPANASSPAPAVTSTGVIRVGLASNSSSLSSVLVPTLLAAAFAVACGIGFLMHRRRRHAPASDE